MIEARIRNVVWAVLAACHPAETPTVVVGAASNQPPPPDAGPVAPDPVPAKKYPNTVEGVCLKYRDTELAKGTNPKNEPATNTIELHNNLGGEYGARLIPDDIVARKLTPTSIECTIVWDRDTVERTVTIVSSCCPPHPVPCPPPVTQPMTAERVKVERAVLDVSTKTITRKIELVVQDPTPPRHMCGRRSEGMDVVLHSGALLEDMAAMEAASACSFDRLARELERHGAPDDLIRRARDAKQDELRHARTTRRLARRYGLRPSTPRFRKLKTRDLDAIARENVVEGCVYETYGAAVATFQAHRATDPVVREAFETIAAEERAHAQLAWDVHEWIAPRVSSDLEALRRRAIASLERLEAPHDPRLGLPTIAEQRALLAVMEDS